jgi:hypothetical protein
MRQRAYGRAAALGVFLSLLIVLLLAFGLYAARDLSRPPASEGRLDLEAIVAYERRVTLMLTIVLASGLLLILFLVGTYFLLRAGTAARTPVGGAPTRYVDAWAQYRVTDEEIAAATAEPPPEPPKPPTDR